MFAMLTSLAAGARDIRSFIRRQPFDRTNAEDRARERHVRVALGAGASLLGKLLSIGTALISVPLTLHYLGPERYGMWMTMSSLVAMFSFADLGIGNGVLNAVAAAYGRDDRAAIRGFVSSGFFALSAVAILIIGAFALAYPFVPWFRIFNVETAQARTEAGPALGVLVACFALAIPVGIVQRVQMGLQCGFMASLWQCASSLFGLTGLLVAIHCEAGLPWLVLAFAGAPLIAALGNSFLFFGRLEPDIAPSPRAVSRKAALRVAHTGMLFFMLQIVSAVMYSSDNLVIAQMLGAGSVTGYAVPASMFNVITMLLVMALIPLWPAYGEAIARGDHAWVRRTLKRSLLTSIGLAAAASTCLVLFGPRLIALWVGHAVDPPLLLLLGLGLWKVIEPAGNALAVFLNGAHVVRPQVVVGAATAACGIILKIVLVGQIGAPGVVWATIISFSLLTALPLGMMLPKLLKQSEA
jgi:O-antigen/teichoic acid export membrane protein